MCEKGVFIDDAIDIVSKIDYDFSLADKDHGMKWGVISRTIVLDDMVSDYISKHPKSTIVNIASGMDTRFNRVDNGIIKWYNVDLENSARFRLNYLPDTDREKTLAYSAMDPAWAEEIEYDGDVLFIIEGLTMYLNEDDVGDILNIIDDNFTSATVFMEIMPKVSVENVKEKSVEETNSEFIWGLERGDELLSLNSNFKWIKDVNLFDGLDVYKPFVRVFSWIPFIRRRMDFIAVLEN